MPCSRFLATQTEKLTQTLQMLGLLCLTGSPKVPLECLLFAAGSRDKPFGKKSTKILTIDR